MTPEETQAALLADWLQSPPGTPAPEGIDEAVLAAVYTLRPGRAPPIRLTLDDILGAVTEGPLAGTTGAVGTTAPETTVAARTTGARASKGTRAPLRVRAARAWWAVPGIGIVVTAAAAALIAIRVGGGLDTPSPEVAMFSEPSATKVAEAPAAPAAPPAEAGAGGEATPSSGVFGKPAPSVIAEAAKGPAPVVADAGSTADAKANAPANAPTNAPTAAAPAPPPPAPSVTGGTLGTADALERPSSAGAEEALANGPAGDVADDAGGRSYQAAEPRAESEAVSQSLAKRDTTSSKDERAQAAKSSAPARGASASTNASAAMDEDAPATAPPAPAGGSSTAMDYNPGFHNRYPEITAAYSAAMAAQSAGRYADALAAYAGFRVSPHADVAQDASWRAAQCLRALGRIDDALAVVVSGLRVSSSNTPFRSNLYSLQGELYSTQGKASEAQRAWAEAARLNALR